MKIAQFLKVASLALCLQLTANQDTCKMSADDGHIYVMESGDVFYSYTADYVEKVKIGTTNLEIYEVDGLVTREEDRTYLETSHPVGIFYPCEMKKKVPASRGFYHVEMENGLDRLIWLNEKVSMIAAQERDEYKVVSAFSDYCLLSDGLIYEGEEGVLKGGEAIELYEEGSFRVSEDLFSPVAVLNEERMQTSFYSITIDSDDEEMCANMAISSLDRGCPLVWFGAYNQVCDLKQRRILLTSVFNEEFGNLFLDPATLQIKSESFPVLRVKEQNIREIVAKNDHEIEFDDGSKTYLTLNKESLLKDLNLPFEGNEVKGVHTSIDEFQGRINFDAKSEFNFLKVELRYDFSECVKLSIDYEDSNGNATNKLNMKLQQDHKDQISLQIHGNSSGVEFEVSADCKEVDGIIQAFVRGSSPMLDEGFNATVTFNEDFKELLSPTGMEVGKKVIESVFVLTDVVEKQAQLPNFILKLYGIIHE